MGMTLKSALKYLKDFDNDSTYQEALEKVCAYVEKSKKSEKKISKIQTIFATNVGYRHFAESMKLSAIYNVIKGNKQEYKFWTFLDEE